MRNPPNKDIRTYTASKMAQTGNSRPPRAAVEEMMRLGIERMRAWQQALADRRIPDLLAYGLSIFSMILGGAMLLVPDQFAGALDLRLAFTWAIPQAWGMGFATSGLMLGIGFWKDRKSGSYAAVILTGLYCLFGILAVEGPIAHVPGGLWSGPIIYTYAAWTSALAVLACQSDVGRGPR